VNVVWVFDMFYKLYFQNFKKKKFTYHKLQFRSQIFKFLASKVKVDFLIVADDQVSATVTIKVGGVVKWSGDLADTSDMVPDYDTPPVPTVSAEFDLEVVFEVVPNK
jgi:hypothetical protein